MIRHFFASRAMRIDSNPTSEEERRPSSLLLRGRQSGVTRTSGILPPKTSAIPRHCTAEDAEAESAEFSSSPAQLSVLCALCGAIVCHQIGALACYKPAPMRKALPAVLLAACASFKPPNATEPPDARERAVTPSDRQLGSRTLPGWPQSSNDRELVELLVKKHGEAQRQRIERGLRQVAAMWRPQDGDDRARRYFVEQWFESDPRKLTALLGRFEYALEQVDGYFLELGRELRIDEEFAGLDLSAHSSEDLFQSKLAFIALLNFPLPTLDEMLAQG